MVSLFFTYFSLDIPRSASAIDIRRDVDVQNPRLSHHRICIYLAHVLPPIFFLYIGNVQVEGCDKIARDRDSRVVSYDGVSQGQNGF